MIDPHVHCRDGQQAYKETISHVLALAARQGVEKVFDMPNTNPPLLRERDIKERLRLVPQEGKGRYFLYLGLTPRYAQLEEAVFCYRKYPQVIGFKLYAGQSVGDLGITCPQDQEKIYQILGKLKYRGVLAVHCEKVALFRPEIWDPTRPLTHFYARPKEAEIEAIKDQIRFAQRANFLGSLHIVHVSAPESIEIIERARKKIKITAAVTPHHLLWSKEMLARKDGLLYKMNPPLREKKEVEKIRRYLKEGKIDWIETDHAPHPVGEKLFPPYLSGFPSLYLYKKLVQEFLPQIGVNRTLIRKLTEKNIIKAFKNKLAPFL